MRTWVVGVRTRMVARESMVAEVATVVATGMGMIMLMGMMTVVVRARVKVRAKREKAEHMSVIGHPDTPLLLHRLYCQHIWQ